MKNSIRRKLMLTTAKAMGAVAAAQMTMITAFASATKTTKKANDPDVDLDSVTEPIIGLVNRVLNVLIPLVAAVGGVYCVSLGLKYAKAEEPQEREKAKQHLKSAIIGFSLIFILVVVLRIASPLLTDWMNSASKKK